MTLTINNELNATVVITHQVNGENQRDYQKWLDEIVPIAKSYPGHLGVVIIKPVPGVTVTFTIVIRFDSKYNLLAWMKSQDRAQLIRKVQPFLADEDKFEVLKGLDFWFSPEGVKSKIPTRWKQFIVTWTAIYPLVTTVSIIQDLIIQRCYLNPNHYLKTLFATGFVVLMMVYVVMPRYTKLVHKWLFH
jgi:antibiotic biosynthesis monooxygenase (ABM) superfamily enzyme